MKFITKLFTLFIVLILFSACSTDSDEQSDYAMTFKINGELFEVNNPFGTNEATGTIFTYYPEDEFIHLSGRTPYTSTESVWLNISIWIDRNDLVVGTYEVGIDTYNNEDTHIDLINNTNDLTGTGTFPEHTISGNITITAVNPTEKTIEGTFEFNTYHELDPTGTPDFVVTEGKFDYVYDVD